MAPAPALTCSGRSARSRGDQTGEEGSPEADRDLRKRLGQFRNEINDLFEGAHEGVAKARTLGVVPVTGQRNVRSRLRAEADCHS